MGTKEIDKLKDKIEKLFRKAAGTDSLEEAEAFSLKAQELLTKYNIDYSTLEIDGEKDTIDHEYISFKLEHGYNKTDGDWLIRLYHNISKYNFCQSISHGTDSATIVGEAHNIEMVRYICNNVVPTFKALLAKRWKEYHKGGGTEKKNAYKRAYLRAAVSGLSLKLYEQREASKKEYSGLPGLIKLTDVKVTEKVNQIFSKITRKAVRSLKSSSATEVGYSDGKNTSIDKGLNKGSSKEKELM